jgi:hypothetical protein
MRTGNAKNWLGIFFIIVGILWLTDNFNLFYFGFPIHHLIFSWHTFMIIVGAIIISNNNRSFWGYIILGYGIIGTLNRMPFFPFSDLLSFGNMWPIVVILLGIWMILNINGKKHSSRWHERQQSDKYFTKGGSANSEFWKEHLDDKTQEHFKQWGNGNTFPGSKVTYDMDNIDEAAVFSSSKRIVTSQNFRGGKVSAIFGSVELNLTRAKLAPGEVTLDVSSIFGSVELRVPPEWKVITNVSTAFGGFEDKRYLSATAQPNPDSVLIIKGSVIFGGGELSN